MDVNMNMDINTKTPLKIIISNRALVMLNTTIPC